MESVFLSVVIPCFDEIANLRKGVLDKVKSFLENKKYSYEVIIVDDGSRDGSLEFVKKFAKQNKKFHILENKHLGKAGAVTSGMLKASGEYRLFTDMDQATPIEEIDTLLPFLIEKKYDISIGSRDSTNMGYPWSRLLVHNSMIILRKIIVGLPTIHDTQCGFKMFTKESAVTIFTKLNKLHNGYKEISDSAVQAGFDVELLLVAQKKGYKIKEVSVHWFYVESRRVSPLRDSIEGLFNLFSIRKNILTNVYL